MGADARRLGRFRFSRIPPFDGNLKKDGAFFFFFFFGSIEEIVFLQVDVRALSIRLPITPVDLSLPFPMHTPRRDVLLLCEWRGFYRIQGRRFAEGQVSVDVQEDPPSSLSRIT